VHGVEAEEMARRMARYGGIWGQSLEVARRSKVARGILVRAA